MEYNDSIEFALEQDKQDPLKELRDEFYFPQSEGPSDALYFTGNSLGLQPKKCWSYVEEVLKDWATLGVEGHFKARYPWLPYHEFVTNELAEVMGCLPSEVVAMNSLTTNLHLLMVSFYRPNGKRKKILMEKGAFPSDQYAMKSQIRFHGFNPESDLIEIGPREGEHLIREEDILKVIDQEGENIATVMFGGINYLTGQLLPMEQITQAAHKKGAMVGFDLAHAAGNIPVKLHDWGVDFACWCHYKYLNGGPGTIGGAYVHEKHFANPDLPRFEGWWGHNKDNRFKMPDTFEPIQSVEAWQLSNPPIFQLAALRCSLELFHQAKIDNLRQKSLRLTGYLEFMLKQKLADKIEIVTSDKPEQRGSQLSLILKNDQPDFMDKLAANHIFCDFRSPNIVRAAPTAMYNNFEDVYHFISFLEGNL